MLVRKRGKSTEFGENLGVGRKERVRLSFGGSQKIKVPCDELNLWKNYLCVRAQPGNSRTSSNEREIFGTRQHYFKTQGMNTSDTHNQRMANMTFASVYPMYLAKVEKKGRTKEELHQVITWLTGFDDTKLQELIHEKVTFEIFFQQASLNPNAHLITGVICGYRVEEIENTLTQQVRYLDKLVDELAKGRKMEKILRGS